MVPGPPYARVRQATMGGYAHTFGSCRCRLLEYSTPRDARPCYVYSDMHVADLYQRSPLYLALCPTDMATVADPGASAHNMLRATTIYDPCVVHVYRSVHIAHGSTPAVQDRGSWLNDSILRAVGYCAMGNLDQFTK